MPRGGARSGAGRPKGAGNKRPRGWRDGDNHGGSSDPLAEHRKLYNYTEQFKEKNPGAERMTAWELLLYQVNDDDLAPAERRSAAGIVLPYERPSLHRVDHRLNISVTRPANELTDDELAAIASGATKLLEGSRVDAPGGGGTPAEEARSTDLVDGVYRVVDGVPAGTPSPDPAGQAGEADEG
jgi:hypothetical protein